MRLFLILFLVLISFVSLAQAADPRLSPPDQYFVARIMNIEPGRTEIFMDMDIRYQAMTLKISSGDESGKMITIEEEDRFSQAKSLAPKVGDLVTVRKSFSLDGTFRYEVDDRYRLRSLFFIGLLFFALVLWFGRIRGVGSIFGLLASIAVLYWFIVPRLIAGDNPITTTLIGALIIALLSMFLAHGFNRQTSIALVSTLVTLILSVTIAWFFTRTTALFGFGTESAFYLTSNVSGNFNFQGLLLGGIIIGMLGVLDDVTTTQTATVAEIKHADPSLPRHELYRRGLRVGREHIASLVNTLALAYAGAALPLFLLFKLNDSQPAWVIMNSELIVEEIVRTLSGSVALILAVPIATWIASRWIRRTDKLS
jgi:uncharacterized membrane protein